MKAEAFKKTKAALSLVLALAMIRPAGAETAQQHYAFVGASLGNDYVAMARNVKDSSEISDIRRQILQDEGLTPEEKVPLIKQVSDVQLEKIDAEARVERNWLIAEASLSALIRGVNLAYNRIPASAGAVDAFAQAILEGKAREAVIRGYETGDWSGVYEVARSVGAGGLVGYLGGVIGNLPALQNAATKLSNGIVNTTEKLIFRNKLSEYAQMEANLYYDLYSTLKPQLGKVQGEMAELYRQLSRAGNETEKNTIRKALALLDDEVIQLRNQIARKEAEITASESLWVSLDYARDRVQKITQELASDEVIKKLANHIQTYVLNQKFSPDGETLSDLIGGPVVDAMVNAMQRVASLQEAMAKNAVASAEIQYRNRMSEIEEEHGNVPLVLHGSVSVDVYPDGNGEYGESVNQNGDGVNGGIVRGRTNDGLRPGTEQDPVSHHGQYDGVDAKTQTVLDAIFDALGWSMDEKTTGNIIDVIIDAIKDGGTKLDQYEQKIGDMLPGDNAKEALGTLLDKVVNGVTDGIGQAIRDFGQAVAVDYSTGIVIDLGLAEGMPVLDIQMNLQALIADGYETGASFVATLNQAVNGGCFGGGNSGQSISIGIQNGQVVVGVGGQQVPISKISPAGVWGTIKSKIQTIALQKLEQFAVKQLDSWINKNPTLQKWLGEIFGIDGQSIVDGLKNIWGVLTGNGTLAEKFSKLAEMAQNALCDMAKHALKWGLEKLQGWLSDIAQKLIGQIMGWISDILGRIFAKFGISISTDFLKKVQDWLNAQVGKGVKKVVGILEDKGNSIIDKFRPSNSGGGGNKTVWGSGQQPATTP